MSDYAALVVALQSARATVAALEAALAAHEGAPCAPVPVAAPPDDWIDSHTARKVAGVERSTIYRWCRRYGIGVQSRTGQWRISRRALLAIAAVSKRGELGDDGDAGRVSMAKREAHRALPLFVTTEPLDV